MPSPKDREDALLGRGREQAAPETVGAVHLGGPLFWPFIHVSPHSEEIIGQITHLLNRMNYLFIVHLVSKLFLGT